jgi:hypothetical protein
MLHCSSGCFAGSTLDTIILVIILVAILLLLAAPVVEIAVRRPGIFLELARNRDLRAFAEAPLRTRPAPGVVANDQVFETARSDKERLAA